jgi:ElaB/YqjD/DUF883 family membrane-anchored ribosome-binding protein
MTQTAPTTNNDKLVTDLKADLKSVFADAEEILKSTADIAGEKVAALRARIEARLKDARARLEDAEAILVDKTKAAARATDDFVHEQPWKAVGVAAIVGVALGVLIGRR